MAERSKTKKIIEVRIGVFGRPGTRSTPGQIRSGDVRITTVRSRSRKVVGSSLRKIKRPS